MPIMIGYARAMGTDFKCYLVEYMRTIVYQIPRLKVKEPKTVASIIIRRAGLQSLGGRRLVHLPERRRHNGPI